MKKNLGVSLGAGLVLAMLYGCSDPGPLPTASRPEPDSTGSSTTANLSGTALSTSPRNFRAHLSGRAEVPPTETRAQGQAIFQLSRDGMSLNYKLIVANIENVFMAHIHLAPAGQNGPIGVWLYPSSPPSQLIPGRSDGPLAEGNITANDLVGPLAGEELAQLLMEMSDGNTYVNVHTTQNPSGEVRGQIR